MSNPVSISSEQGTLLTAVRMKTAMEKISSSYPKLGSIVRVPRASSELRDFEDGKEDEEEDSEEGDDDDNASSSRKRPMTHNAYEQLYRLLQQCSRTSVDDQQVEAIFGEAASGDYVARSFRIFNCRKNYSDIRVKIADQPKCDYDGSMSEISEELMKTWWEHGHLSGYGNVRTQTTETDASVRNAREWKGEEIHVDNVMIDCLAYLWGKVMQPADVRVSLYKLNVYGPGGRFVAHKDTPETDLVGTILLGLGDTTDHAAGLKIEGRTTLWRAKGGSFIMFYPDVTHEVLPVTDGYRATLAFKVFRKVGSDGSQCDKINNAIQAWLKKTESTVSSYRSKSEAVESSLRDTWFPKRRAAGFGYYYPRQSTAEELTPEQEAEIEKLWEATANQIMEAKQESHSTYKCISSSSEREHADDSSSSSASNSAASSRCSSSYFSEVQARLRMQVTHSLKSRATPFGFLLDSQYALGTKHLHGPDQVLFELLNGCAGFKVIVMPVLTVYDAEFYTCDDYHTETAHVYPLTDAHVRGVLDMKLPSLSDACGITKFEADQMKDISIIALDLRNGFSWSHRSQEGADHTGNEALPAAENAIWLHRALIVVKQSDEEMNESNEKKE